MFLVRDARAWQTTALEGMVLPWGPGRHRWGAEVAFHGAVDPRLLHALAGMTELPAAEAWRRAGLVAARYGARRPSYPTVRRGLLAHQALERLRAARRDVRAQLVADLLAGRAPWRWLDARILGTIPHSGPGPRAAAGGRGPGRGTRPREPGS